MASAAQKFAHILELVTISVNFLALQLCLSDDLLDSAYRGPAGPLRAYDDFEHLVEARRRGLTCIRLVCRSYKSIVDDVCKGHPVSSVTVANRAQWARAFRNMSESHEGSVRCLQFTARGLQDGDSKLVADACAKFKCLERLDFDLHCLPSLSLSEDIEGIFRAFYPSIRDRVRIVRWRGNLSSVFHILRGSPNLEVLSYSAIGIDYTAFRRQKEAEPVTWKKLHTLRLASHRRIGPFDPSFSSGFPGISVDDFPVLKRLEIVGSAYFYDIMDVLVKNPQLQSLWMFCGPSSLTFMNRLISLPALEVLGIRVDHIPRLHILPQPVLRYVFLLDVIGSGTRFDPSTSHELAQKYFISVQFFLDRPHIFPSLEIITLADFPSASLRDARWSQLALIFLRAMCRAAVRSKIKLVNNSGCVFSASARFRPVEDGDRYNSRRPLPILNI